MDSACVFTTALLLPWNERKAPEERLASQAKFSEVPKNPIDDAKNGVVLILHSQVRSNGVLLGYREVIHLFVMDDGGEEESARTRRNAPSDPRRASEHATQVFFSV